jgi:hypothetical protein
MTFDFPLSVLARFWPGGFEAGIMRPNKEMAIKYKISMSYPVRAGQRWTPIN